MKKFFSGIISTFATLVLCSSPASGQYVSITANLKTLSNVPEQGTAQICVTLVFPNSTSYPVPPKIVGNNLPLPVQNVCYSPNSSGVVTFSVPGNDVLQFGGQTGVSYYAVEFDVDGQTVYSGNYTFNTTDSPVDLSVKTPLNVLPVVAAPTGDSTYARKDGGNMPFTGPVAAPSAAFTGTLAAGGPSPWDDVTVNGAKCDGVTDDTTFFNNALSAANAALLGGHVCVPYKTTACVIAGQLNLKQFQSVTLDVCGGSYGVAGSNMPHPLLQFTGSTSPLIDARSTQGVKIDGLTIEYTNPAFNGRVIDTEHFGTGCGGGGCDTEGFVLSNSNVTGTSSSANAACLVCLDNTDISYIEKNNFQYAVVGISAPNANSLSIDKNNFSLSSPNGTISGTMIKSLGTRSVVDKNNFELGNTAVNVIDLSASSGVQVNITNNTAQDAPSNWSGTFIVFLSGGGGAANNITGNAVFGGTGKNGNFVSMVDNATGETITGNTITNIGNVYNFIDGNQKNILIAGNFYNGITNFAVNTGTGFVRPASGIVQDNTGATTFWGGVAVGAASNQGGVALATPGSFTLNTATLPTNTGTVAETNINNNFTGTQNFAGQIVSTLATGTAPFSVASTTPVNTLTVNNHPIVYSCSGTSTCGGAIGSQKIVFSGGGVSMSGGSLTISSMPFSAGNSYECFGWDITNSANKVNFANTNGSTSVATGTGTDIITWICIGG